MGKFCGSPLYRESVCNCHLATSWMPDLEKICEEDIIPHDTLTSTSASSSLHVYPSGEFPVSIVLNGTYIHTLPRTDPGGYRVSTLSPPPPGFCCSIFVPFFVLVLSVLFLSFFNNTSEHGMLWQACPQSMVP